MHLEENQWFPSLEILQGKILGHRFLITSHGNSNLLITFSSTLALKKSGTDVSNKEDEEDLPEANDASIRRVFRQMSILSTDFD